MEHTRKPKGAYFVIIIVIAILFQFYFSDAVADPAMGGLGAPPPLTKT